MIGARRFLSQVLDMDLNADTLYRPGPVSAAWTEDGDALFKTELYRQTQHSDFQRFTNGNAAGEMFMRVRAYGDQIVRIRISRRNDPLDDDSPMLQLDATLTQQVLQVAFNEGQWCVTSESGPRFKVNNHDFAPHAAPDGNTWVRFQAEDHFFEGLWDALPMFFLDRASGPRSVGFALSLQPGEHLCGTGERFDRLDLVGRQFDLVNVDALGSNNERAYKNIPFLLSSRPYGLFVHSHALMRVDLGAHSNRSLQWLIEDDALDLFLIGGGSPAQILYNYRCLTGFPAMPPVWSFGAWMGRMTYHSDEQASAVAGRLRAEGYPMDVIHLDTGWFEREWICDWRFSAERFPDPAGFFNRMQARGFKVSLWQYPYIHRESSLAEEARQNDYVGHETNPSGELGLGYTLDFTRPEAAAWYSLLLKRLFNLGAAAVIADFGEEVDEQASYAGMDGRHYHNLFALLYQRTVWEAASRAMGVGNTVLSARSAWAGSQRYPVHECGDSASTFDGLSGAICGGLHLGLSGFAFWSHDIGGFHGVPDFLQDKPSEKLYLRWTQVGVFSSHMRYHGSTSREPWEFPGVAPLVREWLRFRYALLPYILKEAEKCTHSGLPMLRALVIDWPDDPAAWNISGEYMFGDAFLVCPVLNEEGVQDIYLPEGKWVNFWSGSVTQGPTRLAKVLAPLARLPLYIRYGEEIEFCEPVQHTGQLSQAQRFSITFDDSYAGFNNSELARWVHL